jgi:hypothetical protein
MASKLPPEVATQMRTMGADLTVVVTRPDKKSTYLIYPHMKAYAELAMDAESAAEKPDQFKVETTELAKETVDGHACVKNKVTLTDDKGVKHESTVWNATDLKKFPVKIDSNEDGHAFTLTFKDVKLASVDKDAFDAPDGYTKYNDMQSMMSQEMMKHMPKGGGQ